MKQGLSLRVSQHLALTPQLQQSIRLLQLSTLELSQEVEQMLDDNPFLELHTDEPVGEEIPALPQDAPLSEDDGEFGGFNATTTDSTAAAPDAETASIEAEPAS